ncbi:MAG: hypothetical protein IPG60_12310 [Bacteroidetes bacterium]|nr:hypothetical protein [Bacteroidota bacterium]MBP7399307.1 hypothetical protein [Chitinophagales bacterium]MBK7109736.1 hypothetical protein [Bacteroidota bacterium]MBK8487529.1 hypothetical protein [Bacteroidota bacterium]MBK8682726.1 hypothetical protein [Bacteroidota bacterium]
MKKFVVPAITAGIALLAFSFAALFLVIRFLPPSTSDLFYNPVFWPGEDRAMLYYIHPFILSFALSWFWNRFKKSFDGNFIARGVEFGVVYAIIATLPSMWISFSALNVTIVMVSMWFIYGVFQATIAGFIFAKLNP